MKLPINPLLYLVSLGSVGGMVMSGLQLNRDNQEYQRREKGLADEMKGFRNRAQKASTAGGRWNYRTKGFWTQLSTANFTGKVEEKKIETKAQPQEKKSEAKHIDLNDILHIVCIAFAGDTTGVVVNYTATVEVPEEFKPAAPTTPARSSIPKGRRGSVTLPRVPTQSVTQSPPHHLHVGEHLWKPYEYVFVKAVATDASAVMFELRADKLKDKDGKYPTQELEKNVLGLPQDVLAGLRSGGKVSGPNATNGAGDPPPPPPSNVWRDTPETEMDARGNVNVNRKDSAWLRDHGQDVFNREISVGDYSAGSGENKVRGIQVRKLSSRVRQFGLQEGDVVVSINNVPVSGIANAKRIGQRFYNQGVRSFKVGLLRRGEQTFLTYNVEDERKR
ncbi:MAG: hypothetical protein KDC87_03555 [Planctomycetes bacterium]|nr:hypothetical protein [Planctomycetota bacterium]MCB9868499.1 hypothetical protein [Planctomycetota bacterium]